VNTQQFFIATACPTIIIANHWDIFVTLHLLCIVYARKIISDETLQTGYAAAADSSLGNPDLHLTMPRENWTINLKTIRLYLLKYFEKTVAIKKDLTFCTFTETSNMKSFQSEKLHVWKLDVMKHNPGFGQLSITITKFKQNKRKIQTKINKLHRDIHLLKW